MVVGHGQPALTAYAETATRGSDRISCTSRCTGRGVPGSGGRGVSRHAQLGPEPDTRTRPNDYFPRKRRPSSIVCAFKA